MIAPSTVPAAVLGLIFASAGNGTWLSFPFGMVGLVLVSLNTNQFARRPASAGSLYSYIVKGLGPTAGVIGVSGGDLFPPPAYPNNILVWVYLAFMALGAAWLFSLRKSKPDAIDEVFEGKDSPR